MLGNGTALSNGSQEDADGMSASVGVAPATTPEVVNRRGGEDLQSGGSVGNALPATGGEGLTAGERMFPRDGAKEWFVLRITHGKMKQALDALKGEACYYPVRKVVRLLRRKGERPVKVLDDKPLVKDLLFVYADGDRLDGFVKGRPDLPFITYRYDHCKTDPFGKNPRMTVGYDAMVNFVNATLTDESDVRVIGSLDNVRFKRGTPVKVIGGKFKGVRGWVIRFAQQQRVLVRLDNFLNFATSYIPDCYIVGVDDDV